MLAPALLNSLAAVIAIVLSGIGSGIGQGIAGSGAIQAMFRQTKGTSHIIRAMILGLALVESGVILALVITLITLFGGPQALTIGTGLAKMGMGLAIGFSALAISIASSFAVKSICISISRQPFFAQKILTLMLLSQSIIEAPAVFAFIIALLIKVNITSSLSTFEGIKFLAAGIAIAIGAIGPSIGQAIFANSSCKAVGLNKEIFGKLFSFALLCQAIIETPIIFNLVIAIIIIYKPIAASNPFSSSIIYLVAALTISIGSIGTAISTGYTASKSTIPIALNPDHYPLFIRVTLLAQAIIESAAIYALIIALILVTKTL